MERRPCLFGSASAAGILFLASQKGALDLIAYQPRSASLRSARSLRSLAPTPEKCPEIARKMSPLEVAGAAPRLPRTPSGAWRFAPRGALSLVVWYAHPPPLYTP